jgi:hypothetical protein
MAKAKAAWGIEIGHAAVKARTHNEYTPRCEVWLKDCEECV